MRHIIIGLAICGLALTSAKAQEREGVKDEGAHEAEYNANAQERDHSGELDSRGGEGGSGEAGSQSQDASSRANTAGTDTRTVSPAGSPAVLMSDSDQPDGTNTMQRATLNIAGSPLPGASRQSSDANLEDRSENRVFSGEEQKSVSPTNQLRQNSKKE
jgi:hypothetical protein